MYMYVTKGNKLKNRYTRKSITETFQCKVGIIIHIRQKNWVFGSENIRHGRHTYFLMVSFFLKKKYIILCILKDEVLFKMHNIIFFPENLKIILGFNSKFRLGRVNRNTYFFIWHNNGTAHFCDFLLRDASSGFQ